MWDAITALQRLDSQFHLTLNSLTEAFIALVRHLKTSERATRLVRYSLLGGWSCLGKTRLPCSRSLSCFPARRPSPKRCLWLIKCPQEWTLRHDAGYAVACYDWEYEPVAMNYLGAPGFLSLGASILGLRSLYES